MQRQFDRSLPEKPGNGARAGSESIRQIGSAAQRELLRGYANQIRFSRDLRRKTFDPNLFGEPAWDILLSLYIIDGDRRRLNARELSKHANLASTTALRWLDYLEEQELIARKTSKFDRRVIYVELSHKGRSAMDHYLMEMQEAAMFGTVPPANF